MNLDTLISEQGSPELVNQYIIGLTDELAKKIKGINNEELKTGVGIYIFDLLFYNRPKNYKEIELKALDKLLNNLFEDGDQEKYFSGLYKLYLLLQKYPDGNNRVGLLLRMALNKNPDLDKTIKEIKDNNPFTPKFNILMGGINNFINYYIKLELLKKLSSLNLEETDLNELINNSIEKFNNSLFTKRPEFILEKLSEFLGIDFDKTKEDFIFFFIFGKTD